MSNKSDAKRSKIKKRIRRIVFGSQERPRLSVFRSNKEIYAQIINDVDQKTLVAASSKDKDLKIETTDRIEISKLVGMSVGKKAIEAGANEAFSPDEETEIRNKIGIGSAAAIDFVGRPETTDFGLTLVKKGGMVIVVGLYGGSLKLSLPLVPMRSMSLRGSYVGELRELKELVNIIKSGKIKLIPVKKQGLETANQAMSDLRSGKVNGRIVLIPN